MTSNISKTIKKKFKAHNYIILKDTCLKELNQANKLESSLKAYESLNNQNISFKEFTHSTSCEVVLKPLELQYKVGLNLTIKYLLQWVEIGYLVNFAEWSNYPRNKPFIGPDSRLYKIEPNKKE